MQGSLRGFKISGVVTNEYVESSRRNNAIKSARL